MQDLDKFFHHEYEAEPDNWQNALFDEHKWERTDPLFNNIRCMNCKLLLREEDRSRGRFDYQCKDGTRAVLGRLLHR